MKDLHSLPTSVRDELTSVQRLLGQNTPFSYNGNAQAAAFQVAQDLVKQDPALAAAVLCSMIGSYGLTVTDIQQVTTHRLVSKTFLGIPVGQEYKPFTDTVVRTRQISTPPIHTPRVRPRTDRRY